MQHPLMCYFLFTFFMTSHDLGVAGTDFFHGNIVVDDVDDACQVIPAHVCFHIVGLCEKLCRAVIQVGGDDLVKPAFLVVFIEFVQTVCEKTVGGADEYTACLAPFSWRATSSILSPEEIISSMMTTSLPSTEAPEIRGQQWDSCR